MTRDTGIWRIAYADGRVADRETSKRCAEALDAAGRYLLRRERARHGRTAAVAGVWIGLLTLLHVLTRGGVL